jgi:hypothetical protein
LVAKPEGKRPLGRSKSRWVENIKMDLREIEWDGMDQWRSLVSAVMNFRVPWFVGKFWSSCTIGGFSRRAQLHVISLDGPFGLHSLLSDGYRAAFPGSKAVG